MKMPRRSNMRPSIFFKLQRCLKLLRYGRASEAEIASVVQDLEENECVAVTAAAACRETTDADDRRFLTQIPALTSIII